MFKQGLTDQFGYLSSWNRKKDCCQWKEVHCSNRTGHVLMLSLALYGLSGNISSSLLELENLYHLDLRGNHFSGIEIPNFFALLTKLRYLDLSASEFGGAPDLLGNLTNLQSLNMGLNHFSVNKLDWLSRLSKLTNLSLESLDFRQASDWLQVIRGLPSLRDLSLGCSILPMVNHSSLSFVNYSTSLQNLNLSCCFLSNSAYQWLSKISTKLQVLNLSNNRLQGPIPDYAFSNMTSLMHLDLSFNQITGISKAFRDLSSLRRLNLYRNNLTGQLPDFFFSLSDCAKKSLKSLNLSQNMLSGSFPDITEFSSLTKLEISDNNLNGSFPKKFRQPSSLVKLNLEGNQLWGSLPDLSVFHLLRHLNLCRNRLNGTIDEGLGQLSKLKVLRLFSNSLRGTITEAHFSNLTKLKYMEFSYNLLTFNFSFDWFPPFQLNQILLSNCKLGSPFPKWLQAQKHYHLLDISNAGISDTVPTWFWQFSSNLYYLNLSHNHMKGIVPSWNLSGYIAIDLSSNCFEGSIPPISPNVTSLILSQNKFSGSISFLCEITGDYFSYLDLSYNQLSGEIPDCFRQLQKLTILNLANNNFSGSVPDQVDYACMIQSLHLRNNNLTGDLPSSWKKCTQLTVLDVGHNKFSGRIPAWIGYSLPNLAVLSLRSNQFQGSLPRELCNLKNLQVLDFSQNNMSGALPSCLNNLNAMVLKESSNAFIGYLYPCAFGKDSVNYVDQYRDHAFLVWKGIDWEYRNTLGLVKMIDLSSNRLSGKIPEEITSLVGLISLNLSRNVLTGPVPQKIGQLTLLDSLDLSHNLLTGAIPESFSQLSLLGVLDLSNNNFSGKIPSSTQLQSFNVSVYMGNPELCGLPLQNKCPGEEPEVFMHEMIEEDEFVTRGFYVSLALGFITGFLGICCSLLLNRTWKNAYFRFLNDVKDMLYVSVAVKMNKLQRWLRN
ncbi:putative Leucine-rich receptor-like kinase family protein [Melia azedarach]|uniref:Leucine-rich receptor-like kinase family protein n=1 Tax=Melia azedarach TaxID=155640 RepID=A0ACC1YYJ7_MELAZ|nr:putative Leucine-rich receptor-like kinase family protein [Melia azedarach]